MSPMSRLQILLLDSGNFTAKEASSNKKDTIPWQFSYYKVIEFGYSATF
jgi:hypothetical protein